jgi:hypothetical protein
MNGLIGCGEVGAAIEKLYIGEFDQPEFLRVSDPAKGRTDDLGECDLIHVAVPAEFVTPAILAAPEGSTFVVHSTVVPGTCRKINTEHSRRVVHAPVEGRHPNLAEALIDWKMPVSGEREDVYKALAALRRLGIPAESWAGPWEATELAKQMSTLRLGWDVLFMRHCYEMAGTMNIDPKLAYAKYTESYNALYNQKFQRPNLLPTEGPIGGHCVMSNAENIREISWIAAQIAEMGKADWKNPCK